MASTGGSSSQSSAASDAPINWTMQSDCTMCHTTESDSMTNPDCVQAVAHQGTTCTTCHTEEDVLKTAHAGVTMQSKVPKVGKATEVTVDAQTCIGCHGTMQEMAAKTANSTALKDSNGMVVNPHDPPSTPHMDAKPATCTDCHETHTTDALSKDAMGYCAQSSCHHRGVFQCGTCHAVEGVTPTN
jgi:hypothetical protein